MSRLWPYHALLPEMLVEEEHDEEVKKAKELQALNDRLRQLENDIVRKPQLGNVPLFELNTSTIMFGVVVGLVVYILMSNSNKPHKPRKEWWMP